jgi:hypothetical protein
VHCFVRNSCMILSPEIISGFTVWEVMLCFFFGGGGVHK